jgi:hypothetical protein
LFLACHLVNQKENPLHEAIEENGWTGAAALINILLQTTDADEDFRREAVNNADPA